MVVSGDVCMELQNVQVRVRRTEEFFEVFVTVAFFATQSPCESQPVREYRFFPSNQMLSEQSLGLRE